MFQGNGTELLHPGQLLDRLKMREGECLLDIGCGVLGHFVFPAASRVGPHGTVYALDIDRAALERIRRQAMDAQLFHVRTVWSDMDTYGAAKIPTATVDVALIVNVLRFSRDLKQLCAETARLVKGGGRVMVIDWKEGDMPLAPGGDQRVPLQRVVSEFHGPFFQLISEFGAGPCHYGLIFERTDEPAHKGE